MSCDCGCDCKKAQGSRRGCCPVGLLEVDIPSGDASITISKEELKNASHAGVRYDAIRFTGGLVGQIVTVVLPAPASLDDSYSIEVENRSAAELDIYSGSGVVNSVVLDAFQTNEVSLEDEIQNGAVSMSTYRTRVRLVPGAAYRVPGFSGP